MLSCLGYYNDHDNLSGRIQKTRTYNAYVLLIHSPDNMLCVVISFTISVLTLTCPSLCRGEQFTVYVTVLESLGENPLLDSRFPDVSGKGRGYQLEAFPEGLPSWPTLRKVSIWQTVGALEKVLHAA